MSSQKKALTKPPVLVILGTTSAGKTALAVALARDYQGEIISADSRQVYRGLDIGTGKDLKEYKTGGRRVPHHLIDICDPKRRFNLARYQTAARKAIGEVISRQKLPIVVGGSGLYLQALVDNYILPSTKVSASERLAWSKLDAPSLYAQLSKLRPDFSSRLNDSDRHNARRLRRYLEIVSSGFLPGEKAESPFTWWLLGLKRPEEELKEKIKIRLAERLEVEGLVTEVKNLHEAGLSWRRLDSLGLEYRFVSLYLREQLTYPLMVSKLETALWRFAKRQLTWFRRWEKQGADIVWVSNEKEARAQLTKWQKKYQ